MSGTILVVVGPATLARANTQEQSAASQVAAALDPFRSVDAATELRCAVVRLPLANGVANFDRAIALETAKIAASASGTLDFRNETLDLAVKPQIREGIKVDVSQFASLVRIRGSFAKPAVAIDAVDAAAGITAEHHVSGTRRLSKGNRMRRKHGQRREHDRVSHHENLPFRKEPAGSSYMVCVALSPANAPAR